MLFLLQRLLLYFTVQKDADNRTGTVTTGTSTTSVRQNGQFINFIDVGLFNLIIQIYIYTVAGNFPDVGLKWCKTTKVVLPNYTQ